MGNNLGNGTDSVKWGLDGNHPLCYHWGRGFHHHSEEETMDSTTIAGMPVPDTTPELWLTVTVSVIGAVLIWYAFRRRPTG